MRILNVSSLRDFKGLRIHPDVLRDCIFKFHKFRDLSKIPKNSRKNFLKYLLHKRHLYKFTQIKPLPLTALVKPLKVAGEYDHTFGYYKAVQKYQKECRIFNKIYSFMSFNLDCAKFCSWKQLYFILHDTNFQHSSLTRHTIKRNSHKSRVLRKKLIRSTYNVVLSDYPITSSCNKVDLRGNLLPYKDYVEGRVSFLNPNFTQSWTPLTIESLKIFQIKEFPSLAREKKTLLVFNEDGLRTVENKIWLPELCWNYAIFQTHISNCHSSILGDEFSVLDEFFVFHKKKLHEFIKKFKRNCLHCHQRPYCIRRQFKETIHAKSVNEVLHLDYIKVDYAYLLVITDDLSRKTELIFCESPTMEVTVNSLLWWKARYGFRKNITLKTDKGSHFANRLVEELNTLLRIRHVFSIAYSPWTNGSAELMNRHLLTSLRALVSEYNLPDHEWKYILPVIQCHINNKKHDVLKLSPNEIFSGRNGGGSIFPEITKPEARDFPLTYLGEILTPTDVENLHTELLNFESNLNFMRTKVFDYFENKRRLQREYLNRKLTVDNIQYQPGDYVMFSVRDRFKGRSKVKLNWIGPVEIEKIVGDNLYILRDCTNKKFEVHSQRIRFYCKQEDLHMSEIIEEVYLHNRGQYYVKKILNLRRIDGEFWLEVSWRGVEKEDNTWERYTDLVKEIPEMTHSFLLSIRESNPSAALLLREF